MATRLWWIRSVWVVARWFPSSSLAADWAQTGRACIMMLSAPTVSHRFVSSNSSLPMSFNRKVRAEPASTRWRTMPADGSGRSSSRSTSGDATEVLHGQCPPLSLFR